MRRIVILSTSLLMLLVAATALGAVRNVPGSYPTIGAAIAAAVPNDVIQVAAGVYPETVTIPFALSLLGAGPGVTSIDVSAVPTAGSVITASGIAGNLTISGFKIVTGPAATVVSNAISLSNVGPGAVVVTNNELWCVQSAAGTALDNFGLIAGYGSTAYLLFAGNKVYGGGDNPVLLERWAGPVDFVYNTVYRGPDDNLTGGKDAMFVMNYGAANITAKQRFSYNTFDMGGGSIFDNAHRGTALSVVAEYTGTAGPGGYTDVEIVANSILNLKPFRRGLGLWDNSAAGAGDVVARIQCNTITPAAGSNGDHGIRLLGGITGTTLSRNSVSGCNQGFQARMWNGLEPSGFTFADNNLVGNLLAGAENLGVTPYLANNNWWGSPIGPFPPNNGTSGPVTVATWLAAPAPACGGDVVNPVTAGLCVSPPTPCVTVPVVFTRTDPTPMRGYSVTFFLSPDLVLCDGGITEGPYLSGVGGTNFQKVQNPDGSWTVDCAILGGLVGAVGSGTLFDLHLASTATGTGVITVTSVVARDLSNADVPGVPGPPATLTLDNSAPAAIAGLTAVQVKTGNPAGSTTGITVSWPAVEAGATVAIYRKGFGSYPDYDDAGGSAPPTPGPYAPIGWTLAALLPGAPTSFVDYPGTRDFWYYVAYVKDACGNWSGVSNRTGGTLDYHLGDVTTPLAVGDNVVTGLDISALGAFYGLTLPLTGGGFNYLDVGPTTNRSVDALPTTDNKVGFEDLMMFAMNFGFVSAPQDAPQPVASATDELTVEAPAKVSADATFTATLRLKGAGDLQGLSLQLGWDRAVAEPVAVEAGGLLASQNGVAFSAQPGNVDCAVLGTGRGLTGDGELATVTFRALKAGAPNVTLAKVDARNLANQTVALAGAQPGVPAATALAPAMPNPFRQATTLSYALARAGAVDLTVYGVDGRKVATLVSGVQAAGTYRLTWDGAGAKPGMYYARLSTPEGRFTRTLVLTR
jgi:hypothetical protein